MPDDRDRRGLSREIRAPLADIEIAKDVCVMTPALVEHYGDVIGLACVSGQVLEGRVAR